MNVLICADDITASVHRQRDIETPGGVGPFPEITIMGHALGIGVILLVHSLSAISDIIRQNVETIIILGAAGEDARFLYNILGVNQPQVQKLRILQRGEFAILNLRIWPKCVYATFSKPQIPDSCSEDIRKIAVARFFRQVRTMAPAPLSAFIPSVTVSTPEKQQPVGPRLPDKGMEYLICVVTGNPKTLTKIYEQLGLTKATGSKITQTLADLGYICVHIFSTGKRGGQANIPQVTEPGWDLLRSKGISKPPPRTTGDWEHEVAAQLLEVCGKKLRYNVSFEVDLGGGLRVDAQWLDPRNGQRLIYNIGISKTAREISSIVKFFKLSASQNAKFILVVRDTQFSRDVEDKLKIIDPSGFLRSRIEIKLLADYLDI